MSKIRTRDGKKNIIGALLIQLRKCRLSFRNLEKGSYSVSTKYSCGFPAPSVLSIIVVDRYLDYFTAIMGIGYGRYSQSLCSDDGTDLAYQ